MTLARSYRLLQAFRRESESPELYYSTIAMDLVDQVRDHVALQGRTVLDVGSGRSEFAAAFGSAGCHYLSIDVDPTASSSVQADGRSLPIADQSVDVVVCSNVLEHTSSPWALCDELVRVLRPGGTGFISYTVWLSPWGGHETSPWHYLGGHVAASRYERRWGKPPKNLFGRSLFSVSVRDGLGWARARRIEVLTARPRYYPSWASGLVGWPMLREFSIWNLLLVFRTPSTTIAGAVTS